jgi:hypothetical protein
MANSGRPPWIKENATKIYAILDKLQPKSCHFSSNGQVAAEALSGLFLTSTSPYAEHLATKTIIRSRRGNQITRHKGTKQPIAVYLFARAGTAPVRSQSPA